MYATYRVLAAVLGALGVGASGLDEVGHGQVVGELEAPAHVGLTAAQHGRVHGDGERLVTRTLGATGQLSRQLPVYTEYPGLQSIPTTLRNSQPNTRADALVYCEVRSRHYGARIAIRI